MLLTPRRVSDGGPALVLSAVVITALGACVRIPDFGGPSEVEDAACAPPCPGPSEDLDADAPDADDAQDADRGDPPAADVPVTAARVQQAVFTPRCGAHHLDGTELPWLGGDPDTLASRLTAPSRQVPDLDWIVPGHPEESYLVLKVDGQFSAVGGLGEPMPIGAPLSDAERALLRRWVEALP